MSTIFSWLQRASVFSGTFLLGSSLFSLLYQLEEPVNIDIVSVAPTSQAAAHSPQQAQGDSFRLKVSGVDSDERAEIFWIEFQNAVKADDRSWVASHLDFPFYYSFASDPLKRTIRVTYDRREFLKNYDRIFDRSLKNFIVETSPKDLWANWAGIATPHGVIWIQVNCSGPGELCADNKDLKLSTIHANSVFLDR